jgi:hypothetical protein
VIGPRFIKVHAENSVLVLWLFKKSVVTRRQQAATSHDWLIREL